jgi:2-keto-3-deoxy-galactonokinase
VAAIDRMFMITAFSGTRSDRKTTIKSRNDKASTAAKKTGMRPARKSVKSMLAAAVPVTVTSSAVPAIAAGMMSPRRLVTSSVVAASWGAVVGTRVMT